MRNKFILFTLSLFLIGFTVNAQKYSRAVPEGEQQKVSVPSEYTAQAFEVAWAGQSQDRDSYTYTPGDSPAASDYSSNTYTENGWTDINVTETGFVGTIEISYTWATDSYAYEGSFHLESPAGTSVVVGSGESNGDYSKVISSLGGEDLNGNWKLWIEDSYGDGGHQATGITVVFNTMLNDDLGVTDLMFNSPVFVGNTNEINAVVSNLGADTAAAGVSISFTEDGTEFATATTSKALATGEADTVSVNYTASTNGDIELAASVPSDEDTSNDTLTGALQVLPAGALVEDFNAGTAVPDRWDTTMTGSGTYHWETGDDSFIFSMNDGYALLGSDVNGESDTLVTPQLTLDGTVTTLDFSIAGGNNEAGAGGSTVQVVYSADGNSWTTVGSAIDLTTGEALQNISIDLSGIANGDYYFGFAVTSTFDDAGYVSWVGIDDVSGPVIASLENNDLKVERIQYPKSFIFNGDATTITADIKNVGLTEQSGTEVMLIVNENDTLTETIGTLDYNQVETVEFTWTAIEGRHEFKAEVAADDNTANDSKVTQGIVTNPGLLTEGFEGTFPPEFWTPDENGIWQEWTQEWTAQYEGEKEAAAGSASGFDSAILATPLIELTGSEELNFYATLGNANVGDADLKIVYSADGENWTQVGDSIVPSDKMELYTYDLSGIPAGTYHLGFMASGSGDGTYATYIVIDHVVGPAYPANDLAVTEVITPETPYFSGDELSFEAVIKNYGSENQAADQIVTLAENGVSIDTAYTSKELGIHEVDTVSFSWSPASGAHDLTFSVIPDSNPANDSVNVNDLLVISEGSLFADFEDGLVPPEFWSQTGEQWEEIGFSVYEGDHSAMASVWTTNDTLITPKLTITGGDSITFYAMNNTYNGGALDLLISSDKEVWDTLQPIALTGTYQKFGVTLADSVAGEKYIGFAAYGGSGDIKLDYIVGPQIWVADNDAALQAINPDGLIMSGTSGINVELKNNGLNTLTEANIVLKVDGEEYGVTNWTGSLETDSTAQVSLGNYYFEADKAYDITVYSENPNGVTDELLVNDTIHTVIKTKETFVEYPPAGWTEAEGKFEEGMELTGTSSSWTDDDYMNDATHENGNAAKLNLYGSENYDWMFTPTFQYNTKDALSVSFDMALMEWNDDVNPGVLGADDTIAIVVSTDGGQTWNYGDTLDIITAEDTTFFDENGEAQVNYSLEGYSGDIKIGFYGGSNESNEDNDLFIDNFRVLPTYAAQFNITDGTDPIANAQVTIGNHTAMSDSSGIASIELPDGGYEYLVENAGYVTVGDSLYIDEAGVSIDVLLENAFNLTFHVNDGTNFIEGATVEITNGDTVLTKTTDVNGEVYFEMLSADFTWDYTITYADYAVKTGSIDALEDVHEYVTLEQKYPVTFNVTDGTDSLQNATIELTDGGETWTRTTDVNGDADFGEMSVGSYDYTVTLNGYQTETDVISVVDAAVHQPVVLEPVYDITINVTNAVGDSIEAAYVELENQDAMYTDALGDVHYTELLGGSYLVSIQKAEMIGISETIDVSKDSTYLFTLDSATNTYDITFHVMDQDSVAIENANIDVTGFPSDVTDVNGDLTITGAANGTYSYTAMMDGYTSVMGDVTVADANVVDTIMLQQAYDLAFTLTDQVTGNPIEGAEIELVDTLSNTWTMMSDVNGEVAFTELLPGAYDYTIMADGYEQIVDSVEIIDADIPVVKQMNPYFNVTFNVRNDLDYAVGNATINIENGSEIITTTINGLADVELINGTYNYEVTAADHFAENGTFTVNGADMTEDVVMTSFYTVSIAVVDETGTLVEGATVEATDGTETWTGTTDASGMVDFTEVPAGNYNYDITEPTHLPTSGSFEVVDSDITVTDSITAIYNLTFNVVDEYDQPIENATVAIDGEAPLTTDASGNVVFDSLFRGGYTYEVTSPDHEDVMGNVEITDSDVTQNVSMNTFYTVTFNVTDGTNALQNASIEIDGQALTTDASGVATIELINGNYGYEAALADHISATGAVVVDGAAVTEDVTLTPLYTVTFNVTDGTNPIDGVYITVNGTTLTTNSAGEATIDVENGDYAYTASLGGYTSVTDTVNVAGADVTEDVALSVETHTVTFNVTDAASTGIEGATVTLDGADQTTDASGIATFTVDGFSTYDYTVSADGYNAENGSVTVNQGDVSLDVVLTETTYTVTFMVEDTAGAVADAQVVLTDGTNDWVQITDANGEAQFTNVAPNDYDYSVTATGYEDALGTVAVVDTDVQETVVLEGTGINDATNAVFTVYPNPSTGVFYIEAQGTNNVTVLNAIGKVVTTTQIHGNGTIDLTNSSSGIYFIRLQTDNNVTTKRVIVE